MDPDFIQSGFIEPGFIALGFLDSNWKGLGIGFPASREDRPASAIILPRNGAPPKNSLKAIPSFLIQESGWI
jgi:hypothetical protein